MAACREASGCERPSSRTATSPTPPSTPEAAMIDDATHFLPVRELAARIRARKLSPVEFATSCLDRLEKLGPRYNAVVTVMRESALAEARKAEREIASGKPRGLLHGIPYGVKDLVATKDAPTTWGAAPYKDQRFDFD